MSDTHWVWDDYTAARQAFLAAAAPHSPVQISKTLPGYTTPAGQPLCMDGIRIGPADAIQTVICLSGVHGLEGPAGSAVQTHWLRQMPTLPKDLAVILIHAVNPYGFAHKSRSTEENVDLNRAFLDRSEPLPDNPGYAMVHPYLAPAEVDDETLSGLRDFLQSLEEMHGPEFVNSAVGAGQYTHPDGLYFGGHRTPWSVETVLEFIKALSPETTEQVGILDLHTGRGGFGEPFYLCFDQPGTDAFKAAAGWWGRDVLLSKDELGSKYQLDEPPPRTGLLYTGLRRALSPIPVAGCVLEFGTYDLWTMYDAEIRDRWVRFQAEPDHPDRERVRMSAFRAFTPADDTWRQSVLTHGTESLNALIEGISTGSGRASATPAPLHFLS